uniref:Uncharacterized protein n=1 Tax=Nothobranchius kadleci TaxID=1051664 RepID=A0A1A8CC53_NOTKA
MKSTVAFLVLSMLVLMAQPSEGFFGLLMNTIPHIIGGISSLVKNRRGVEQVDQQHLDQNQDLQQLDQDQQLDQQQLEQEKFDQKKLEQEKFDQKKLNKFLLKHIA